MLIQALAEFADSRLQDRLEDPAFESKPVPLSIEISSDGRFLGWITHEETVALGKKQVKRIPPQTVPRSPVNRNSRAHPLLAFDDAKYVFGVGPWTQPHQQSDHLEKHRKFVELVSTAAETTHDEGLSACAAFYSRPEQVKAALDTFDTKSTGGILFSLHPSGSIPGRSLARDFWREHYRAQFATRNSAGGLGMCLVSGKQGPIAPTHDKIKGTASIGGQPAGVALMSFDKEAFQSYGWESCANSPVSPDRAQAYVLALNHLLAGYQQSRIDRSGTAFLYWLRTPTADFDPMALLEQANPDAISNLLLLKSGSWREVAPNEYYFLAVSGNGGRLVVRQWIHESLQTALQNVAGWFEDLQIADCFSPGLAQPPKMWELLACLARDQPPPGRALELLQRALHGRQFGADILATLLGRLRADQGTAKLKATRAALLRVAVNDAIKTKNNGDSRMNPELNHAETNAAYLCGRLLALFDSLQYHSSDSKLNRTLADRYFSLASTFPALAFPKLEDVGLKYLAKLRRTQKKAGTGIALDRQMNEIRLRIGCEFPRQLSLLDQGRFALGFHHQRAENFQRRQEPDSTPEGN